MNKILALLALLFLSGCVTGGIVSSEGDAEPPSQQEIDLTLEKLGRYTKRLYPEISEERVYEAWAKTDVVFTSNTIGFMYPTGKMGSALGLSQHYTDGSHRIWILVTPERDHVYNNSLVHELMHCLITDYVGSEDDEDPDNHALGDGPWTNETYVYIENIKHFLKNDLTRK